MSFIQRPYLTTLTPLRGIAALLVVLYHSDLMVSTFVPRGYTGLVSSGPLWVDFFFILSGFILFYVYGNKFENTLSRKEYWKYIGARFARVYPLHLFTLIWAAICVWILLQYADGLDPFFAAIFNLKAIPSSLLLMQSLHLYVTAPLNTPSWSLSTEWWVYMIFPFIVPFFSRLRISGMTIVFLLIAGFYVFLKYVVSTLSGGAPTLDLVADFGLLRCLAGFFLGMLLYRVYYNQYGYSLLSKTSSFVVVFFGILVAMHFGAIDFFILSLFPFLLLTAAYNTTAVKKLLDTKPLQRLGDWSFSIYMVHIPIAYFYTIYQVKMNPKLFADFMTLINTPPDYQRGVIICIVLVILTLVVAALTYNYIEVPARNYLNKRFAGQRETTGSFAVSENPLSENSQR